MRSERLSASVHYVHNPDKFGFVILLTVFCLTQMEFRDALHSAEHRPISPIIVMVV